MRSSYNLQEISSILSEPPDLIPADERRDVKKYNAYLFDKWFHHLIDSFNMIKFLSGVTLLSYADRRALHRLADEGMYLIDEVFRDINATLALSSYSCIPSLASKIDRQETLVECTALFINIHKALLPSNLRVEGQQSPLITLREKAQQLSAKLKPTSRDKFLAAIEVFCGAVLFASGAFLLGISFFPLIALITLAPLYTTALTVPQIIGAFFAAPIPLVFGGIEVSKGYRFFQGFYSKKIGLFIDVMQNNKIQEALKSVETKVLNMHRLV